MLATLPPHLERIDLVLWDYGVNDWPSESESFRARHDGALFFPHLFHLHPEVTAIGAVHWLETINCTLREKGTVSPNLRATRNYPYLKHMFNPDPSSSSETPSPLTPFSNVSLFAISLPQFCNAGYCNPYDFIRADSRHQSDAGVAIMADLVIWHLLPYFDRLIERYCRIPPMGHLNRSEFYGNGEESSLNNRPEDDFKQEYNSGRKDIDAAPSVGRRSLVAQHDNSRQHGSTRPPNATGISSTLWFLDANLTAITAEEGREMDQEYQDARTRLKDVVAAMFLMSPVMRPPLSLDLLALRCLRIDGSSAWVQVDIVIIIKEGCLGWVKRGFRRPDRSDEEFYFHPNKIPPSQRNGTWEENPKVRNADLLLRVNASVGWKYVCFLPCAPIGNCPSPATYRSFYRRKAGLSEFACLYLSLRCYFRSSNH